MKDPPDVEALQAQLHALREEDHRLVIALNPRQRLADLVETLNMVDYAVAHGLPLAGLAHLIPYLREDADRLERLIVDHLTD
jgi:hypothetical protein